MQVISLKVDESLLKEIDGKLEKNRYATRTEFIRDAIRDKLLKIERHPLSEAEKVEMLKAIDRLAGSSKRKTTDAQLHEAREKAFEILGQKFK